MTMKIQKSREIVIEYEHIRIIRKRAKTLVFDCIECRTDADFVSLKEAAKLFSGTSELLFQFIENTGSHYQTNQQNEIFICLNSLLAIIKRNGDPTILKLPGK